MSRGARDGRAEASARSLGVPAPAVPANSRKAIETLSSLPLFFEANRGQAAADVKYLFRSSSYTLFFTPSEAVVASHAFPEGSAVRLQFVHQNAAVQVEGLEPLPGIMNYFGGNQPSAWLSGVPTYAKVAYRKIYPGIDMVFYGNQRQLEYDFVLAPGARPEAIRLRFAGVSHVALDEGDLGLEVAKGQAIRLRRPLLYQEKSGLKQEIAGSYSVSGQAEISFRVGAYDHTQPLYIDPVLSFSSYLGGSGTDEGRAIATDSSGFVYIAGRTNSADLPADGASRQPSGKTDVFLTKMKADGSAIVYSTYWGGSDDDVANAIAADADGNVYLAGSTHSADFPTRNPLQPSCSRDASGACSGDAFVAKFDAQGTLVYSTLLGGSGNDAANAIAVDLSGNAYIAGSTSSTDFPVFKQVQSAAAGDGDAFVAKISPDGSQVLYATYLGGSGADEARGIAVDAAGSAYVTGQTSSLDFPMQTPLQANCALDATKACTDAFVAKLAPDGSALTYSTYLGGSAADAGNGIAVDAAGNAYITGSTASADFPTVKPFQGAPGGQGDAFVTKLDSSGSTLVYSTFLGGSGNDVANAIALDVNGGAHVTGSTTSSNFPQSNAVQPAAGGGADAFIAGLDSAGATLLYSTYLGGRGNDVGRAIAVDTLGGVFVTGSTDSTNLKQVATLRASSDGSGDAFVASLSGAFDLSLSARKASANPSPKAPAPCTNNFTGPTGGSWGTAGNWSGGVPISTDVACIPGGVTVLLDTVLAVANQSISALNSSGTLNMSNGLLTLTNESAANNLIISTGTLTANALFPISGTLTLGGSGTLTGTGQIDVAGLFSWSGGTMSGAGVTNANGSPTSLDLSGAGQKSLQRTLNNKNTASYPAAVAALLIGNGGVFHNLATGTFNAQSANGIAFTVGGAATFTNDGTFNSAVTTGDTDFNIDNPIVFNNTGTVNLTAGSLSLNGGGTSSGAGAAFNVSSGATLRFASVTYNMNSPTSVSGLGSTEVPSATLNFNAGSSLTTALTVDGGTANLVTGLAVTLPTLTLSNGTVTGTDTINSSGLFSWSGGTMGGAGVTNANGSPTSVDLSGVGQKSLQRTLNNKNTASYPGGAGALLIGNGGVFHNLSTGTFTAQSANGISFTVGGAATFTNDGIFNSAVTTGDNDFNIDNPIAFNNTGTVNLTAGSLSLAGGGASSGPFNVTSPGQLRFNGGTFTLTSNITGTGTVDFSGGTANLNSGTYDIPNGTNASGGIGNFAAAVTVNNVGPLAVSGGTLNFSSAEIINTTTLTLSSGTVSGSDTINISGLFTWSGGTMSGAGVTNANGSPTSLDLSGAGQKSLQRTLNNKNTASYPAAAAALLIGNGGVFHNLSTGTFTAQSANGISFTVGGVATFTNDGTFNSAVTTGDTDFNIDNPIAFNNTGTVNVTAGSLSLNGGGASSGAGAAFNVSSGATLRFASLTYNMNSPSSVSGLGSTEVPGATLNFNAGSSLTTALTVDGGTANLVTGLAVNLPTLTLSSGTVTGTDTINISGLFTWSGGTMGGAGVTNANGSPTSLDLSGAGQKSLQRTLNNKNTASYPAAAAALLIGNGGVFHNLSTGTFNANSANGIPFTVGGAATFNNDGTFNSAVTTGDNDFNIDSPIAFNNTGTVNLTAGSLSLAGGGASSGPFNVTSPGQLRFNGGTFTLTSNITGTGTVDFSGGTANLNSGTYDIPNGTNASGGTGNFAAAVTVNNVGPLVVSGGTLNFSSGETINTTTLTLSSGTVTGTDTINIVGLFTWSGGAMSGAGVTNANGSPTSLDLSGAGQKSLQRTLNNKNTASYPAAAAALLIGNGGVFHNLATGTFNAQSANGIAFTVGGVATFTNDGTFNSAVTTGDTDFNIDNPVVFNNTGTVNLTAGSLSLAGGGTSSGAGAAFNVSSGATLRFANVTYNMNSPSSVSGLGSTEVPSATLNFNAGSSLTTALTVDGGTANLVTGSAVTLPTLTLSSGTVTGTDTINISGLFTWSGGTMGGAGVTNANGSPTSLDLSGAGQKSLQRTLNNKNTASYPAAAAALLIGNGGVFHNLSTGTFNANSANGIPFTVGGAATFTNDGTFNSAVTTGDTDFNIDNPVAFNNTGTVNLTAGSLSFGGTFAQTAGSTRLSGGNISSTAAMSFTGGTLVGNGTITGSVSNAGGAVAPGFSAGTLNLTGSSLGNYTQGASGAYNVEIGGLTAGSQFDQVNLSGTFGGGVATLDGTLNVTLIGGFTPSSGNSFTIMTFNSRTGTFATTSLPALGGGLVWNVVYNATSVVLTVSPPVVPDLSMAKSHVGSFTVGTNGVYTLAVTNVGSGPTTGAITVSDTLPTGLGFVSGTGAGWACSAVGSVVTCTNAGPLAAAASTSITLTVSVAVAAVPSVTNTASVSTAGDANPANDSSSDPTTVNPAPVIDLSMVKSHTGSFTVGTNGVYSLTVTNVGTASTTGAITVSDTLPTGLGFVSGTGTGWSCSAVGQVVTCTNAGPLAASATSTITLTVSVGAAAVPSVTNTASVSTTGDANPANNSSSDLTTVNQIDLSMVKSHTGSFTVGTNGVYSLAVTNVGTASTSGTITVSDTLPTGLGFVSGTGTGWSCSAVGQVVTCTNAGPLAASGTSTITLTVSVAAAAVPSVTNTASVATAGDSNAANNSSSDPTTVNPAPVIDLSLVKSHTASFTVGTNGVYSLAVTNVGTASTTGAITVSDTLPTGLGFVSGTGTSWSCSAAGQVVTCTNAGPLAASATSTITLTVSVGAAAVPSVTNTATVSTTGDSNAANNSSSDPTTVLQIDLSIVKSHVGSFTVGINGVYTLAVTNVGTASTTGTITVSDTLPTGLGFVSGSGTGWSCSAVGQVVTCTNAGPLAASATSTITLTVSVAAAAVPSVTNTASVATTGDSNAANNSSSDLTTVNQIDLSLVKSHTGSFTVGTNGVYSLAVTNVGTASTSGTITVSDTLPTGLGFVSGTGTGWSCSAVGLVVTCTNAGPLAASATSTITLTVSVAAAAVPSVTNTASVATAGDGNAANNSSSDPTTVNAAVIDLSLAKSHTGSFTVGTNGVYSLAVTNVSTASTTGAITVSDTLPTGLGFVSGTGTGWSCSAVGQVVTCTNAGPLAASATSTITLTVSVGAAAVPSVANTASVATAGDANAANNFSSDPTTVNLAPPPSPPPSSPPPPPVIDLSLVKSHIGSFTVGTNGVYSLAVTNVGNMATTGGITVSDTLPTGLGFVSGSGTGWSCSAAGQVVTCTNAGPIAGFNDTSTITLTVSVGAAAAPSVTNTASVSTTGDTNAANNSSSDPTTVNPIPVILDVVNNASYAPSSMSVTAGSIAAVFGSNLNDGSTVLFSSYGPDGKLVTTLGGASVTINDIRVPIFYSTPGQLGVQIPFELAGQTSMTIQVNVGGNVSVRRTFPLDSSAPGMFTVNQQGTGIAAVLHQDNVTPVSAQNPARPTEVLVFFATGLGALDPALATGTPATGNRTVTAPTVAIDGVSAQIDFSGGAPGFVGLYQINVRIPASTRTASNIPVVLTVGGKRSNSVTIPVSP